MTIGTELSGLTYSVHHNPNCPKPFLVRLPRGSLDFKIYDKTRDICGFGMSFEEAAADALRTRTASSREGL